MPSHAEVRMLLEHVLRGIVIAVVVVMLWQSLREPADSGAETLRGRGVGELPGWSSMSKPLEAIHLQLDSVPTPRERAWLAALAGAGTRLSWNGDLPPVMIDAQPVASPTDGARILVAAPRGSSVAISDDVGPIDTVQAQLAGVTLALGSVAGELRASAGGSTAATVQRDSVSLHRVLVIGTAGWESKFVVAALEEEGWKVNAFIRVAPSVEVTQGSTAVIDTSRYSAVIALDGAATPYANRLIEFVRVGGGVVLAPQAASFDAFSLLRAGDVGRAKSASRPIEPAGAVTLATLSFAPIISMLGDAIPLERRAGSVTTAARRIGAGRLLQLGHDDTWRWRMSGGEGAVRDHRLWWTEIVSSVAYAPPVPREAVNDSRDVAPTVSLVDAIGPGSPATSVASLSGDPSDLVAWLFVLLALGIVGEAASRRLRGAS